MGKLKMYLIQFFLVQKAMHGNLKPLMEEKQKPICNALTRLNP